ncbi:hypothetical protein C3920_13430, partial [Novacetimonas pomaceti]
FAHWASVSTKRSIRILNHIQMLLKSIIPNRPQKASEERRLFEKRRHPKTFVIFKRFPMARQVLAMPKKNRLTASGK